MKKIKLIFRRPNPWYIKVLDLLFVISLGEFYLNYLLPTNSSSRVPFFRDLSRRLNLTIWENVPKHKFAEARLRYAKSLFVTHIPLVIICVLMSSGLIIQILANIYPMWIQIYFGIKSYRMINKKKLELSITT
jgi:hypothetical protein